MDEAFPPIDNPAVAAAFADFPADKRPGLLLLRSLIFETAAAIPEIGRIEETLKWGQPAYLTPETGAGTTIRLGVARAGDLAIYTHCQTRVIPDFREIAGDAFDYDGNRGVLIATGGPMPSGLLRLLISAALTYHRR